MNQQLLIEDESDFYDIQCIEVDFNRLWNMTINSDGLKVSKWRGLVQNKNSAFCAYKARLKQGYTHMDMEEGCIGYASYKGSDMGSKYVMMLATFLGPNKHFMDFKDMDPEEIKSTSTKNISTTEALTNRSWAYD
jgi:hypothetical protein